MIDICLYSKLTTVMCNQLQKKWKLKLFEKWKLKMIFICRFPHEVGERFLHGGTKQFLMHSDMVWKSFKLRIHADTAKCLLAECSLFYTVSMSFTIDHFSAEMSKHTRTLKCKIYNLCTN